MLSRQQQRCNSAVLSAQLIDARQLFKPFFFLSHSCFLEMHKLWLKCSNWNAAGSPDAWRDVGMEQLFFFVNSTDVIALKYLPVYLFTVMFRCVLLHEFKDKNKTKQKKLWWTKTRSFRARVHSESFSSACSSWRASVFLFFLTFELFQAPKVDCARKVTPLHFIGQR